MSITYECPPSEQTKDSTVTVNWLNRGITPTSSQTPTFGNTTAFKQDVTWGYTGNGDPQGYPGVTFKGSNGKDHWATYEFGTSGGLFCPAHVLNGFSLESKQNSQAGHGLWLRRIGLKFINFAGQTKFWGGAPKSSRNGDFSWHTMSKGFSSEEQESLKGFVVKGLVIEVSTQGGTGTRETQLEVGHFRLHYSVGPSNSRWVIGKRMATPFVDGFVFPKGFWY